MKINMVIQFLLLISFITMVIFWILEFITVTILNARRDKSTSTTIRMKETVQMKVARTASWGLIVINLAYFTMIVATLFFYSVGIKDLLVGYIDRPDSLVALFHENYLFIIIFAVMLLFKFALEPKVKR